jgi:ABC-type glycerol-3-phosphate transport system permease component
VLAILACGRFSYSAIPVPTRVALHRADGHVSLIGADRFTGDIDYGEIMAASVAASLPVLIVFLAAQKHFVKGLTIGAIKG